MSKCYIIGELVVADMSNTNDKSDIEGLIVVLADLEKHKIYFNIQVPKGYMDSIMPSYWTEYVIIKVDNTDVYLFESIDYAEEKYQYGIFTNEEMTKIMSGDT